MNIDQLSLSEMASYCTIRIETQLINGSSVGTGFFMKFNDSQYVIVTNKHVVKDAVSNILTFVRQRNGEIIDAFKIRFKVLNPSEKWIFHPEDDVDLCFINIDFIIKEIQQKGDNIIIVPFTNKEIPSDEDIKNLKGIEDLIVAGYPNGIWDVENNKPIFRKGITATHPKFNYNGKKEFLIDLAIFPGSSGSPVLILYEGFYSNKISTRISSGILLLGVVYAVYQHTVTGEIITQPINQINLSQSNIPNNLGIVINSSRLLELEQLAEHQSLTQ